MKKNFRLAPALLVTMVYLAARQFTAASSVIPLAPAEQLAASGAVFRGIVVGTDSFRDATDGLIYTRTSLRVIEKFKGTFPTIIAVVHPGGAIGGEQEFAGNAPQFAPGGEYLLYLMRRSDGKLTGTQGSSSAVRLVRDGGQLSPEQESLLNELRALTNPGPLAGDDVTDQTGFVTSSLVSGLLVNGAGISARFLQADRGEVIPVLIDADSLPVGISLTQATNAVAQAFNAWAAVTKLKFKIEGVQSFGAGADTIAVSDEKLRVQLHDNYNRINTVGTLGIGGRASSFSPVGSTGWDLGGRVGTNEFHKTARGYVVLEHGAATMQNLSSFTEVLCHEIGHALSMAHSSENPAEPDNTLKQAIMYFQVHADGRGATLGAYDPPVIAQAYPSNTVPYTYSRVMDVTTDSPAQPNIPGINELELRGYDLQSPNLTLQITNATANNGSFTVTGNTVKFTANGFINAARVDPAGGTFYDIIYARFSDGTNASPYVTVRVISMTPDTSPSPAGDGIPDAWMIAFFGNANPAVGLNHGANQDADGDGLKNLDEYRAGMNPTNAASSQRITLLTKTNLQFQAKAYELYELHASTNLTNWFRAANPVLPTTATGTFADFTNTAPHLFFRVEKVP